jgi:hypothetical protein
MTYITIILGKISFAGSLLKVSFLIAPLSQKVTLKQQKTSLKLTLIRKLTISNPFKSITGIVKFRGL